MDESTAEKLARDSKIDREQIVREEWEMVVLKRLFEADFGRDLIFRGGTALRLAYGSPRFSEDLDFSLLKDMGIRRFGKVIEAIEHSFEQIEISDLASKYYTYLAELKVKEPWRQIPSRIKIEISKRKTYRRNSGYDLILLNSPATNIQVLANVATLGRMLQEKYEAGRARAKPRDLFDIWYISQKLKVRPDFKNIKIPKKTLKRDLRKYLPMDYWQVIDRLG